MFVAWSMVPNFYCHHILASDVFQYPFIFQGLSSSRLLFSKVHRNNKQKNEIHKYICTHVLEGIKTKHLSSTCKCAKQINLPYKVLGRYMHTKIMVMLFVLKTVVLWGGKSSTDGQHDTLCTNPMRRFWRIMFFKWILQFFTAKFDFVWHFITFW